MTETGKLKEFLPHKQEQVSNEKKSSTLSIKAFSILTWHYTGFLRDHTHPVCPEPHFTGQDPHLKKQVTPGGHLFLSSHSILSYNFNRDPKMMVIKPIKCLRRHGVKGQEVNLVHTCPW